jgi:hypothetical protein
MSLYDKIIFISELIGHPNKARIEIKFNDYTRSYEIKDLYNDEILFTLAAEALDDCVGNKESKNKLKSTIDEIFHVRFTRIP